MKVGNEENKVKKIRVTMRKGEKVVFISTILAFSLRDLMHLTVGKVYTVTCDHIDGESDFLHLVDDVNHECGFAVRTYKFEKLSVYRKKKLERLYEHI